VAAKEQYDRDLSAALHQDKEAQGFIDQLSDEIAALKKEQKSNQTLLEAIARSNLRPRIFGAEQLSKHNDQQQDVLLGELLNGKQAVIQGNLSTNVRLICELFDWGILVRIVESSLPRSKETGGANITFK
jgi:hypothetical protein